MRTLILVVPYPFIAHYSVTSNNPWPAVVLLFLIAASVFGGKLRGKGSSMRVIATLSAFALAGFALYTLLQHYHFAVLFFPPIFISFGLFLLFGQTMLPGKTPLITHMAMIYHEGDMEPALVRYTWWLTLSWVLMFAFLTVESILLAIFASLETWSLYTNGLNYVFILALVIGEHLVRIRRFSHIKFPGLVGFIQMLKKTDFSSFYKH